MSVATIATASTSSGRRRGRGRAGGAACVVGLRDLTGAVDGYCHDISAEQWARGVRSGRYIAVCGRMVVAASLMEPPGPRCLSCEAVRLEHCLVAAAVSDRVRRRLWRQRHRWLVSRCRRSLVGGGVW